MRRFVTMSAAAALAVVCGGVPANDVKDLGRVVAIEMSDFAFSPATIKLRPGERVTFSFRNTGTVEHEFMAGTAAMKGDGYMQDWLALAKLDGTDGDHGSGHLGAGVRVAPRATTQITLVVPPQVGEFEFGCFLAGYYESGMKGILIVDGGTAPNAVPRIAPTATPPSTVAPTSSPHAMDMDDSEQH